jgi:hypothetical protein
VSHALVSVSASDEEHGSTVGDSTNNGTASDDGAGLVDSAAGANVTSHGTTVTRSACRASTWLGSCIGRAVVTRKLAGGQRAGRVDQHRKIVHRRVLVVPESIRRVTKLCSELSLQVLGNSEQSQSGDETLVLHGVQRLETKVLDLRM